jgi:hypothetical protein
LRIVSITRQAGKIRHIPGDLQYPARPPLFQEGGHPFPSIRLLTGPRKIAVVYPLGFFRVRFLKKRIEHVFGQGHTDRSAIHGDFLSQVPGSQHASPPREERLVVLFSQREGKSPVTERLVHEAVRQNPIFWKRRWGFYLGWMRKIGRSKTFGQRRDE